jgi:hypothetical protein
VDAYRENAAVTSGNLVLDEPLFKGAVEKRKKF